ncbi:MAG: TraR/DksA family transcriptional regulator [Aeromicrobium sp.]|jgi:DnaK suppressor protein|nr:TraR/DksA family transcriptional regulator [Aeromicrobium sp.]
MTESSTAAQRLTEERRSTNERLAQLRDDFAAIVAASADSNADDEHDPEGSTIAFERAQVGALIEQGERHLAEIEAAQGRIDADTYGQCESCGRNIAPARLEARPIARTCIDCAGQADPA